MLYVKVVIKIIDIIFIIISVINIVIVTIIVISKVIVTIIDISIVIVAIIIIIIIWIILSFFRSAALNASAIMNCMLDTGAAVKIKVNMSYIF